MVTETGGANAEGGGDAVGDAPRLRPDASTPETASEPAPDPVAAGAGAGPEAADRLAAGSELARLTRELAEASLDADRVLGTVAEAASRLIGGLAIVQRYDVTTGEFDAVAAADLDRARAAFVQAILPRLRGREDPDVLDKVLTGSAAVTKRRDIAEFLRGTDNEAMLDGIEPIELELAHAAMRARNRTIGILTLVRRARPGPTYTPGELALLEEVAAHAALAIDNADAHRRLSEESAARRRAEVGLRRAAQVTELLARLSQSLAEVTLDFAAVLETAVAQITAAVADGAGLYLVEPGTTDVRLAAAWYRDPTVEEFVRGLKPSVLLAPDPLVERVIADGRSVLVPVLDAAQISGARSDALSIAMAIGMHSVLAVPLLGKDGVRGALLLGRIENRTPFGPDDIELCEALAARAALAIDNAALHRTVEEEIAERRRTERRLAYQATHDHLTDLANRALFTERLATALKRLPRLDTTAAVLFLDLDRFKVVNDSLGHESGDLLLREAADRLRTVTRPADCLARLGGDEFAILVEDVGKPDDAVAFARRITEIFAEPFDLDGNEVFVTPSVGIAIASEADADPADLLRRADLAMYRAKEAGRNRFEIFDDAMRQQVMQRLQVENALYRAIDRHEFAVHYQPVLQIGLGGMPDEVLGFEALLTWSRDGERLPAAEFIGIAEDTGLIVPIGAWVLRQACTQLATWHAAGPGQCQMHVNLSARQLHQPDIVDSVAAVLAETGIDPATLCLELTETAVMYDPDTSLQRLGELRALGVGLAVDDFGTGYSSLTYLKRFPIDVLKVDKSFVADLPGGRDDEAIVDAVITLGHALGLRVIAEGVETPQQLSSLVALGCDAAQGFVFSRPVPADAATEFWQARLD